MRLQIEIIMTWTLIQILEIARLDVNKMTMKSSGNGKYYVNLSNDFHFDVYIVPRFEKTSDGKKIG